MIQYTGEFGHTVMRSLKLLLALTFLVPAVKSQALQLTIDTFAGNGSAAFSGDGGPAKSASLNLPVSVATDPAGNVYIADQNNNRIRMVNLQGVISTFAGNGAAGFSGDGGPGTAASLNSPTAVFFDGYGNVFIADVGNQRIRKVDQSGTITTVAGSGALGFSGDGGPPTSAAFHNPVRVIADNDLNIYIADQSNHRVREVFNSGVVTTIAGTGAAGFSGDGGPATLAALNNPTAIALDLNHNLYITDQFNQRIRKVDSAGNITTIAGNGSAGFAGDGGDAKFASLNYPGGLTVDSSGNIFFADDLNFRVREISASGIITTVAGNGIQGALGDGGPASGANLNGQFGVAIDPSGNLLIADSANNRIRIVAAASPVAPVFPAIGVTNGASFISGGSAGALGTIFGVHLSVNLFGVAAATTIPLPNNLSGTTVTVNGFPAPINAVVNVAGSEQINFQMPWEVSGKSTVSVVINNGVASSAAVSVPIFAAQPGIFSGDGINGAIEHLNGSVVSTANPAAPGEYVVVFATGLGPVSPAVTTGQATPGSPLSNTTFIPTATIEGLNAPIIFSGEAPYFVGLNQINLQVPSSATSGTSQDLILTANGVAAKSVSIAIK